MQEFFAETAYTHLPMPTTRRSSATTAAGEGGHTLGTADHITKQYPDGTYVGNVEVRESTVLRSGRGKMTYTDGDEYDGHWLNDAISGVGTYTSKATGASYTGEYYKGKMNCSMVIDQIIGNGSFNSTRKPKSICDTALFFEQEDDATQMVIKMDLEECKNDIYTEQPSTNV